MSFGAGSDTFPTDEDINALVDPDDDPTAIITASASPRIESTKSKAR